MLRTLLGNGQEINEKEIIMKTKMEDLPLTPLAPRYQKELDKINKKKMIYVEPEEYITESMRKILEEGNSDTTKKE